ncbi:MAG: DUF4065 domain-containing protein [Magnetococcales bacterium]|nr:DUF4065 domain-containing protein [Magnetococcales bacterium]MBF0115378.1 DUF4065 domain-containing protein [Magnetococcales bacterium]
MATVFDVAEYILEKKGPMTAMKLQKLVYYSQAWHATWEEKPLFDSRIEAWANGPVVPDLYSRHRGAFLVGTGNFRGNSDALTQNEKESIDRVIEYYGDKNPQWLSDLTHLEDPWILARKGLDEREAGSREITLDTMLEYYSGL